MQHCFSMQVYILLCSNQKIVILFGRVLLVQTVDFLFVATLSQPRKVQLKRVQLVRVFKLMSCFPKRVVDASNQLNLCQTLIKKYCRQCGMPRWPQRKIRALDNSITQSEKVLKKLPKDPQAYNRQHYISLRKYEDTLEKRQIIFDQFLANYYAREFELRRGGREKFRRKKKESEQRLSQLRQQTQEQYCRTNEDEQIEDYSYLLDDLVKMLYSKFSQL
eukprot:TRINITY_DN7519_c2_g1_i2.p1 TRINITY_DN7519_c2_g1~~TRINITY_DN7519_c2_g1_i2.p1  ORF type:complete len:219 (-),score=1.74 TRINITY_DN7519_c2_g1_i2:52-708(-)